MKMKAIITWIGVVSGLLTILLVFENPFKDKAELYAYIEEQKILVSALQRDGSQRFDTKYASVLNLKNVGELVAKDIHIKANHSSGAAVFSEDGYYKNIENSGSIYIERLEPGTEVDVFYLEGFLSLDLLTIEDSFTISSSDSGKATLRKDIRGEGIIWYVEEYFPIIVVVLFSVPVIGLYMLISFIEAQSEGNKSSDKSMFHSDIDKLTHAWTVGLLTEEEYIAKGKDILDKSISSSE